MLVNHFQKYKTERGLWVEVPGKTQNYIQMPGEEVPGYLEDMVKAVKKMKKDDGDLGEMFHKAALERAKVNHRKSSKKYNKDTDCFE